MFKGAGVVQKERIVTPKELRDFKWYSGNLDWLPANTIFLTKHGSHAYGTNTPTSDLDIKGIAIAPRRYYLGALNSFEQAEVRHPIDAVVYDVQKFFKLAWDCNPNIIEILYTSVEDWIVPEIYPPHVTVGYDGIVLSPAARAWACIGMHRDMFLSQKALHTFSGYAMAQLKRLRSHRGYLLDRPTHQPTRAEFDLPEGFNSIGKEQLGIINARVRKLEDSRGGNGLTRDVVAQEEAALVETALHDLNVHLNLMPLILRERAYARACREWKQYQDHLATRNPARAELEAKFGFDTKHGLHLVRLMRMAKEILSGQGVIVKRPDAEELLAIRAGAWSYDQLLAWAHDRETELKEVVRTSPLPREPNRGFLDHLLVQILEEWKG